MSRRRRRPRRARSSSLTQQQKHNAWQLRSPRRGRRLALGDEARTAAALLLVDEVEEMMVALRQELDVADAARDDAWR